MVAQQAVNATSTEIPALPELIATLGEQAAGADYVVTVKSSQPTLLKTIKRQPWTKVPVGHAEVEKRHGRITWRTLKVIQAHADLRFPGASPQLRRVSTRNAKKTVEVAYLITSASLPATSPARIAAWIRGLAGATTIAQATRQAAWDPPATCTLLLTY